MYSFFVRHRIHICGKRISHAEGIESSQEVRSRPVRDH